MKLSPIEISILVVLENEKKFMGMENIAKKIKYVQVKKAHVWMEPIMKRLIDKGFIETDGCKRYGVISDEVLSHDLKPLYSI